MIIVNIKVSDAAGMNSLESIYGNAIRDGANNDLILNEYGLNMKVSNQYNRIVLRWFGYIHRINKWSHWKVNIWRKNEQIHKKGDYQ